jgi:hypothetical protein
VSSATFVLQWWAGADKGCATALRAGTLGEPRRVSAFFGPLRAMMFVEQRWK